MVAEKILSNYIKSEVINKQLGKNKGKSGAPLLKKKKLEPDLFELPPIPNQNTEDNSSESDFDDDANGNLGAISLHMKGHNIHSVDVTSEAFLALPTEIQHEILLELRDTRKQSSWNRIHQMPQEADDFSGFQMERLLKRRNLQQRLNEVVKEIGQQNHEQFALNQGDVAESHKIASDNSTHYVLIKKALQHSTSPTKIGPKKATDPNVIEQPIKVASVSENLATEQILEVDEDGFSQQELFAIFGSEQKKEPVMCISSSDEDSDFEEVPSALPYPGNRVILDIPINPAIAEEDDMFADIFTSAVPSKTEKPTHQSDDLSSVEKDSSMEEPDVFVVPVDNTTSCKSTESIIAASKETVLSSTTTTLEKENILILSEITQVTHGADLQLSDENSFVDCKTVVEQPHSLSEVIDVMVQKPLLENSAFVKEHVSSPPIPIGRISTEPPPIVQCDNLSQSSSVITIEETSKMLDTHNKNDVEGSFEVRNVEITGENSRSQVAFEVSPKTTKLSEPPSPVVHTITTKRKEELEEMGRVINEEQSILIQEHGRQERLASSITDQMYSESQELLRLFGIPYLVAPMEAEAQCAFLDEAGLTQGTITDDSDIWLFGGRRVYKNFFNQGKFVEFFEADDIYNVFKLGREKLVHLALLTGSDYTEGIQGVGPVCALEILAEFPNPGLEALEEFSNWLHKVQAKKNAPPENKIRQKIRNLQVKPGFPNRAVVDAYHNPEINASRSKFSWTDPDMDALRDFLHEKIGWNRDKFNSVVTPVLERFKDKQCQTRIDTYFSVKFPPKMATIVSKRVMNALRKADFGGEDTEIENTIKTSSNSKARPTGKEQRSQQPARSKKILKTTKVSDEPKASTSGDSSKAPEIIWQKENDKQKLVANKLKAIELFKKSRGRGKRLSRQPRPASSRVQLSESDSNSS
ncbi:DNA excision repair protein ERCC-5-like isoform X2 [Daphnia pulex]|nr:DNA excision repair protein ERCC-5-like isoform X2 [Daphnia pulex]